MVLARRIDPTEDEILYHYCSPQSFESILKSKRIRFSDVNAMNDSGEFRWGYRIFENAATKLLRISPPEGSLSKEFFDAVDAVLSPHQLILHPTIACFSEKGDILSQWRAYAGDGMGFAIGFSAGALADMPVTLLRVLYDPNQQEQEMMRALYALALEGGKKGLKGPDFESAMLLAIYAYALKNPAFSEEHEARAVHVLKVTSHDGDLSFADGQGELKGGRGGQAIQEAVQFRIRDGVIIPYVDLPFGGPSAGRRSIKEVILGPRNPNRPGTVAAMLGTLGSESVQIKRSVATYR